MANNMSDETTTMHGIAHDLARKCDALTAAVEMQIRMHERFPPQGSARWEDMESRTRPYRDCDCDRCICGRAALAL